MDGWLLEFMGKYPNGRGVRLRTGSVWVQIPSCLLCQSDHWHNLKPTMIQIKHSTGGQICLAKQEKKKRVVKSRTGFFLFKCISCYGVVMERNTYVSQKHGFVSSNLTFPTVQRGPSSMAELSGLKEELPLNLYIIQVSGVIGSTHGSNPCRYGFESYGACYAPVVQLVRTSD